MNRLGQDKPAFHGTTYQPDLDFNRLSTQLKEVANLMRDGQRRTIAEIKAHGVRGSEAAISARLRDIARPLEKGGRYGWKKGRERRGDPRLGIHEYWFVP